MLLSTVALAGLVADLAVDREGLVREPPRGDEVALVSDDRRDVVERAGGRAAGADLARDVENALVGLARRRQVAEVRLRV
jgi:hypothetical protein